MLRSVILSLRQPFTCIVPMMRKESGVQGQVWSSLWQGRALLHSSACCRVLDKDAPHKKTVKSAQDDVKVEEEVEVQEFRPGTLYPTLETAGMIIDGVRFDELPIVHIKATNNNTLITVTNSKGIPITRETGGSVGFRNAKKGTNIAAQAAAVSLGEKSLTKGVKTVRVSIKGVGPGRMAALKGLQMAGLTIVSITDATPLPFNGNRPRKQRHL